MNLPAADIREILSYDPATGVFRWIKVPGRGGGREKLAAGDVAGTVDKDGYRVIGFRGRIYRAARLAWWFVYGYMPEREIDHENGIPGDDRLDNLRPATPGQNQANRGLLASNTSGFRGVSFHRRTGRWRASICVDRRQVHLGHFATPEAAAVAYDAAAREHFGEFARLNFGVEP